MESLRIRRVEIGVIDCYKKSWDLIKKQYWILFAVSSVAFIIAQISLGVLLGVTLCGAFVCTLKAVKGENVIFEDFFKGFGFFLKTLLPTALFIVPVPIIAILGVVSLVFFSDGSGENVWYLLLKVATVEFILTFLIVCLHTLLTFSFLLIADKNLSGWQSVLISSKAVWQNLDVVVRVFLVGFVLALIGNVVFCAGIYFVLPLILVSITVLYREIFYET